MKNTWKYSMFAGAVVIVLVGVSAARAQIQYATGQNVAPIYEGWIRNDDGSVDMVFGYLNRNWEEVLCLPIGPDNEVQPEGPDRGQPTIFVPRRVAQPPGERREQFVFRARVPKGWGPKQEIVWTLTAHGRTDRAVGTLDPLEEIDAHVISENRGGGIPEGNKPPVVTSLKAEPDTVTLPGTATLTALLSDDGLPKPRPILATRDGGAGGVGAPLPSPAPAAAGRRPPGLRVKWVYYRGPGPGLVTFKPEVSPILNPESKPVTNASAVTTVSFKEAGTYVLRAFADDGSVFGIAAVTVNVTGGPSKTSGK